MRTVRLWGWLAACTAPAVVFPDVVAYAAVLPEATGSVHTFDPLVRFTAARVAFPLVAASSMILLMLPGLMLTLMSRRARTLASWAIASVPATLGMLVLLPAIAAWAGGFPSPRTLAGSTLFLSGLCALAAIAVRRRRGIAHLPAVRAVDAAFIVGVPLLLLASLAPKFLWEDFNGDGAHAFEASRLLLTQAWPFFPAAAGDVASFPGLTSMLFAFPNAWFLGVFGEVEAAVRMPYALYVALLGCAVQGLAELGRAQLARTVVAAIWISLVVFTVTMAFSATYSPYNADLAMPATQDTLLMVCVLGFAIAMVQRSWGSAAAFGFATYVSLPSGLMLLGFWFVAELVVVRPRPWRAVGVGVAIVAGSMLAATALGWLIAWSGSPAPGTEYSVRRTIADLMVLQVAGWRRFLYAAVPGGIFPAVTLLLWRLQDDVARRVTLVALAYFVFFFVQSRISLHHFVPAMLLPVAVAARMVPSDSVGRRWTTVWLAAAAVALLAVAPGTWRVSRVARPIADTMSQTIANGPTGRHALLSAGTLLNELFPPDWDPAVPDSTYGGSALVWLQYIRPGRPHDVTNYVLTDSDDLPPTGLRRIAHDDDAALYVRSDSVLTRHRSTRPVGLTGASIFRISQRELFQGREGRGRVFVGAYLRRLGLDVDAFISRSGH